MTEVEQNTISPMANTREDSSQVYQELCAASFDDTTVETESNQAGDINTEEFTEPILLSDNAVLPAKSEDDSDGRTGTQSEEEEKGDEVEDQNGLEEEREEEEVRQAEETECTCYHDKQKEHDGDERNDMPSHVMEHQHQQDSEDEPVRPEPQEKEEKAEAEELNEYNLPPSEGGKESKEENISEKIESSVDNSKTDVDESHGREVYEHEEEKKKEESVDSASALVSTPEKEENWTEKLETNEEEELQEGKKTFVEMDEDVDEAAVAVTASATEEKGCEDDLSTVSGAEISKVTEANPCNDEQTRNKEEIESSEDDDQRATGFDDMRVLEKETGAKTKEKHHVEDGVPVEEESKTGQLLEQEDSQIRDEAHLKRPDDVTCLRTSQVTSSTTQIKTNRTDQNKTIEADSAEEAKEAAVTGQGRVTSQTLVATVAQTKLPPRHFATVVHQGDATTEADQNAAVSTDRSFTSLGLPTDKALVDDDSDDEGSSVDRFAAARRLFSSQAAPVQQKPRVSRRLHGEIPLARPRAASMGQPTAALPCNPNPQDIISKRPNKTPSVPPRPRPRSMHAGQTTNQPSGVTSQQSRPFSSIATLQDHGKPTNKPTPLSGKPPKPAPKPPKVTAKPSKLPTNQQPTSAITKPPSLATKPPAVSANSSPLSAGKPPLVAAKPPPKARKPPPVAAKPKPKGAPRPQVDAPVPHPRSGSLELTLKNNGGDQLREKSDISSPANIAKVEEEPTLPDVTTFDHSAQSLSGEQEQSGNDQSQGPNAINDHLHDEEADDDVEDEFDPSLSRTNTFQSDMNNSR